jgi:hypothetical protein
VKVKGFFTMIRMRIGLALAALTMLGLMGCGGGDSGGEGGDEVTRELLAGATTKTWRMVSFYGNQNYPADGERACAARVESVTTEGEILECGANDRATINSDGTFKFRGFGRTWSLSGDRVTLDYGSALGTQVVEVIPETVSGRQRLRLLQVSLTRSGTLRPHDDGVVIILEEVAG